MGGYVDRRVPHPGDRYCRPIEHAPRESREFRIVGNDNREKMGHARTCMFSLSERGPSGR
jgi:hypothetical protein